MQLEKFSFDNSIVRKFAFATVLWAIVGMLVGVIIAFQLAYPALNLGISYTSFGRLRPLHTNAVIFAFVGNGIYTGVYYMMPRLLKTSMWSKALGLVHFWGWQLIIVSAAVTLPLGLTQGKEYAELIWPIDIAITLIWVVFGINMFATILTRRERHLYVAIWFIIGTWVTVALLHIVNSFSLPTSMTHSYSWYAGVQDALVQWWYGHNAVAFFLTTPMLGIMYYFVPKAAGRPVYSYKWSIIHFWALIFIYIWAGPHHLLYTALPDWAQSLGVVFSIMLILPSWGGMLNGIFTLRGAWDKVKEDPILKMFIVALTCYGMSTFEGPMLSLKNVNGFAHYTDWIVAHVHVGALGWNGFLIFGMLYWLVPRIYNTKLHSVKMANTHFLIGTVGILLYAIPMYWAAISQALMWKQFTPEGQLKFQFLETVTRIIPMYILRGLGGTIYLVGVIIMVVNLIRTAKAGSFVPEEHGEAPALAAQPLPEGKAYWHSIIERRPVQMLVMSLIVVSVGGAIEIIPTFIVKENVPTISTVKPYTPLELQGRDIYIREGCYTCHSQMVRPFRDEVARYGDYSKAGESVYDHPFQWGSKRTGPDLARQANKYPNSWHYRHMNDPEEISQGSIMPPYPWLLDNDLDISTTPGKIRAMQTLGVPYPEGYDQKANNDLKMQADEIAADLNANRIKAKSGKEIIALIAYLQRLGADLKKAPEAEIKTLH
ncbi:cytochrome-c oxidase, cbb3-type subunit I [Sediminibacterium sp.]|uniref:cytochrome-c oxidase, cbb3-type subunit I n=1 Tax=Sediminibacterium sp. TaxID=1917865 RepID=UPI0027344B96|nr:cytochrome-c oxidase, cbb3-type subunit I [Sediminibacterium sp.]MDP3393981.1 cytochrome-c oxidase, cbb3-type subunit I [Sediminibacterium sp.]MDP3566756.1 cytochrome-c oxidase, cbb3-type subunit I [Sediminibacterium sp.]